MSMLGVVRVFTLFCSPKVQRFLRGMPKSKPTPTLGSGLLAKVGYSMTLKSASLDDQFHF